MSEIKRYEFSRTCALDPGAYHGTLPTNDGDWVRYEDHQAALTAEREKVARYKDALKKANDLAELMERRWYLLRQAVEEKAEEWEASAVQCDNFGKDHEERSDIPSSRKSRNRAAFFRARAAELRALEKDHAG